MNENRANGPRPSIADALQQQDVIWLGSTCPDGRPHLLPLWFLWDGEMITVLSKPGAQKVDNIRSDPRVMVAVGEPSRDFDVELVEAVAELAPTDTRHMLLQPLTDKYGDRLALDGITSQRFVDVYAQPIRIRPTRWLGWGGRGWAPAGLPA